ncbi:MAG: PEP-CTERM sorting domain-containing protein [Burkholderiaceae bacterium]|nr:PEP-CTERM sorting domain-containing protein [Burkholderiaceae bacterium]
MVKFLSTLALAAGLAASASASAGNTYNLGTLPAGVTDFGIYQVNGTFSDTIDFTLSNMSNLSAGVGTLNFSLGGTPYKNISDLDLTLYTAGGTDLGSGTDITLHNLSAGGYYAVISGIANGSAGGEYGGAISVSAVPEPGTVAMMLAGMGLLGYIATRRKV